MPTIWQISETPSPQITQRDLAKALDLDLATVSRGLKNSPRVALKTRERIQAKAKELGYIPDPGLSQLVNRRWDKRRSSKVFNIACLYASKPTSHTMEVLQNEAKARDVGIQFFGLNNHTSEQLNRILKSRGIEGILFVNLHDVAFPDLEWDLFTVVSLVELGEGRHFHMVRSDVFLANLMATEHLAKAGSQRIGLITFPMRFENDLRRMSGYHSALQEAGLDAPPAFFFTEALKQPERLREALDLWLEEHQIEAVVYPGQLHYPCHEASGRFRQMAKAPTHYNAKPPPFLHIDMRFNQMVKSAFQQILAAMTFNQKGIPEARQTTLVEPLLVKAQ